MIDSRIFPTILLILDLIAAIVYFSNGDIKKGVYWISAAVLTFTVTY
jgi:hypothetical protein